MGAVFVSKSAAALKSRGEGVEQPTGDPRVKFLRWQETILCPFITSCILGSILKMEVVCSNETLLPACQTTWCRNLRTLIFLEIKFYVLFSLCCSRLV